jgi:ligand-binding SRPBCC domain-containing protein
VKIIVKTHVESSLDKVREGFTQDLFLSLNPPFPPVKLLGFGGCKKGDQVSLELNFIFFKQQWISDIVEDSYSKNEWSFVDVGVKLPFFLSQWKHHHIVRANGQGATIIDDIEFSSGSVLTNLLLYPALYLQFIYRKPIYQKIFKR